MSETKKERLLRMFVANKAGILAGGIGGIFMDATYYPFETIKSRIQASSSHVNFAESAKGKSLFAGFSTVFYVSFPGTALYFLGYDGTRYLFRNHRPQTNEHVSSLISAFVAELFCNTFRNPFEVVKQQMQVGLDSTVSQTCRGILRSKGFKGFYAGFSSLMMREVPYSMIQMPVYELMKKWTTKRTGKQAGEFSFLENIINGAVAGGSSGFFTNPIDVIKTRLMTDRVRSLSIWRCAQEIYLDEGFRGFSRGIWVRTLGTTLIIMVLFVSYENLKRVIDKKLYGDVATEDRAVLLQ